MRKSEKPIITPQHGYVVVWACFLMASISLTVQWKHAELKLRDERQDIAEETFKLRAQISIIQDDLKRCLNQTKYTYPPEPASGMLKDLVCRYTSETITRLWTTENFLKLRPSVGFHDWRYADTPNGYRLTISSKDGNRVSIAALQRVKVYVLPNNTTPWLGDRVQVKRNADGINWTMTISVGQ
jgi:hypothetical protein